MEITDQDITKRWQGHFSNFKIHSKPVISTRILSCMNNYYSLRKVQVLLPEYEIGRSARQSDEQMTQRDLVHKKHNLDNKSLTVAGGILPTHHINTSNLIPLTSKL